MSSSSSLTTVVASPALSTASWSQLDNTYQLNVAAANQVIQDFLNSPHNTWNYPSPLDSPRPARERYSVPPASPLVAVDRIDTPPSFLHVLADVAAQQAYILSPQLQYPPANEAQDAYVHLQFEEVVDRVPLADIPVENLPPAVVEAPVAIVPLPAPPTPVLQELPLPVVPLYAEHELFPHLWAAPPCSLADDVHPHQYTVVYERGEKIWCPQEEFIFRDILGTIPRYTELDNHPAYFVTPFRALAYHHIQLVANGPLPNVHLCAKVGRHPPSLHFPFGYLESSFIDSLKFTFGRFPPTWLEYFEGALVPLLAFDFLDGRHATLVGRLHFTVEGIFVIDRSTRTEDLLRTQPHLAQFVCTPRVPTRPFLHLTPPPVELPL